MMMMMGRENGHVFTEDDGGIIDGALLGKKPTGFLSWMVMDASGREKILEVDKHEIMHRVQIHARDFRVLDPLFSSPSTILVREGVILLNLEHIKAIITSGEVLLQAPFNKNVTPVVEELRRRIQQVNDRMAADERELLTRLEGDIAEEDDSPFEFIALEVALDAICSYLNTCSTELEEDVYPTLDMLTSKISSKNLDGLRKLKSQMTRLTARVEKVRDEIEQLLDDDDDMADLYLSRRMVSESSRASRISLASSYGDENDVEKLEMLLEAYFIQIDGTLNKLASLREFIDSTEDYLNIQLDHRRNQLIQLDMFLSTAALSITIFSLVTGIFGVNIPYTWKKPGHGYLFKWVLLFTGTCCASLFVSVILFARRKGLVGS